MLKMSLVLLVLLSGLPSGVCIWELVPGAGGPPGWPTVWSGKLESHEVFSPEMLAENDGQF